MNADADWCSQFGVVHIDHGHTYAFARRNGVVACRHMTHDLFLVGVDHFVAMARNGATVELDAYDFALQSFGFLLCEGLLSDKFGFVQFDKDTQSGLQRSDVIAQFVSVER